MKSEKGMNLIGLVVVVVVLMMIASVTVYVLVGPNGELNREVVEPLAENTTEEQSQV